MGRSLEEKIKARFYSSHERECIIRERYDPESGPLQVKLIVVSRLKTTSAW
jgi:hypothetical protein